jgi:hypothetical protein
MISILFLIFLSLNSQAEVKKCSLAVESYPKLHPANSAKSEVVRAFRDEDGGVWYELNVRVSAMNYEVENQLGLNTKGQLGNSTLPHPETMNLRLRKLRPQNQIQFIADSAGTLRLDDYLRYLSKDQIPVGFDGQFIHDLMDHSAGYVLLSETPVWPILKKTIQNVLEPDPLKKGSAQRLMAKINAFLEASTTGLSMVHSEGPAAFAVEVQRLVKMVERIHQESQLVLVTNL